jgi:septal ring factor EnvC (AmiA/AmiB activator)
MNMLKDSVKEKNDNASGLEKDIRLVDQTNEKLHENLESQHSQKNDILRKIKVMEGQLYKLRRDKLQFDHYYEKNRARILQDQLTCKKQS